MPDIDPNQTKRVNQILWLVLIAAQLIYVALTLSGLATFREQPFDLAVFPIALAAVALATGIGAHVYWRRAVGAGRPIHSALQHSRSR